MQNADSWNSTFLCVDNVGIAVYHLYCTIKHNGTQVETKKGVVILANTEIREMMHKHGVRQWEVAEKLNVSEFTLSRKMRHEFTPKYKKIVIQAILEIAERKGVNA